MTDSAWGEKGARSPVTEDGPGVVRVRGLNTQVFGWVPWNQILRQGCKHRWLTGGVIPENTKGREDVRSRRERSQTGRMIKPGTTGAVAAEF